MVEIINIIIDEDNKKAIFITDPLAAINMEPDKLISSVVGSIKNRLGLQAELRELGYITE